MNSHYCQILLRGKTWGVETEMMTHHAAEPFKGQWLICIPPGLTLKTQHLFFQISVYVSYNKQQLLLYTLTDWSLKWKHTVLSVRRKMHLYIYIDLILKELINFIVLKI